MDAVHLAGPVVAAVLALPEAVIELRLVTLVVGMCASSDSFQHEDLHLLTAHHGVRDLAS